MKLYRNVFLYGILMVVFACGTLPPFADKPIREAIDIPENFMTKPGVEFEENSCKNPLIDPRTGVEIYLVESLEGMGDYRVPSGSYGVEANELLRVDCRTGKVIGIVRNN
ncbi:hypothetical protein C7S20_13625 [Christiangramia fulva]|uniref:Lipoprotein n=1 Tax=Christiangramia fulva TaxID=2126553 RepID=A0A2R3Z7K0_9FLAO|nr:hypothetical protein [Christiangramia fulva]AVR46214.1 hypothetical protein C7S20_13625 [Christiangramia fulva]